MMMLQHPVARRRIAGFNLIELMIVVAIVGVLAAIGFPTYQNYARQSKRADAHEALSRVGQLQERFLGDVGNYATTLGQLGYPAQSPQGYWTITMPATSISATGFTVNAQPRGNHSDPDCANISITAQGVRNPDACW